MEQQSHFNQYNSLSFLLVWTLHSHIFTLVWFAMSTQYSHSIDPSAPSGTALEERIRDRILERLRESGKLEDIRRHLEVRLRETQWEEEVKQESLRLIREKGLHDLTVDSLMEELRPYAMRQVKAEVKSETMEMIRREVEEHHDM
eukprot:TRINITY_DN2461_c0_g1_i1.p1 TRINITY_DN2461_c0_g1~~TRINITY_DN2461_c0_g1_i1.p1  ORF type:complete len:145 (-),score=39.26 TRINITY_DN2461_c0_g1_i1:221-655(-)